MGFPPLVMPAPPGTEFETAQSSSVELPAFLEFKLAAQRLRDSELSHRAAQEAYRGALDALNRAVAPTEQ